MTNPSARVPTSRPSHRALPAVRLIRDLRNGSQSVMFVGDFRQRRTVVDVKRVL
jgi:hypothetical protein